MRRRALLAANMPIGGIDFGELPPESTRFEFPLYLNLTKLDYEDADYYEYGREEDDITSQLYDWFEANAEYDTWDDCDYINLDDTCQIYINGVAIQSLRRDEYTQEIFFMDAPAPFDEVYLIYELWGYIYK